MSVSVPSSSQLSSSKSMIQFRVVETEPTTQGYVSSQQTCVYVIPLSEQSAVGLISSEDDTIPTSIEDTIEINEDFLGNSILLSIPAPPSLGLLPADGNLTSTSRDSQRNALNSDWRCSSLPLEHVISSLDDHAIYISTRDLNNVGVLNGEWAVVRSEYSSASRIVRVVANDSIISDSGAIFASPSLLFNIVKQASQSIQSRHDRIAIRPTPFGSRRPPAPIARSITVARVASPITTDRSFEDLFVRALTRHFQVSPRLLKRGDIVSLPLNTDELRSDDRQSVEYTSSLVFEAANHVVHFVVTDIEHGVIQVKDEMLSTGVYLDCTLGELGCWIDSEVTRVLQAGIEHFAIPSCEKYFDICKSCPYHINSHQCGVEFDILLSLASAAMSRNAIDYHLQLSVLLQGSRGVGKVTTAVAVARQLGIHVYEVNCYDIVGESAVQSEALVRTRFERASSCSPCILLLRHIEAFSQQTQTMEQSKGSSLADVVVECVDDLQLTWGLTGFPVLVFATTSNPDQVPPRILASLKHQVTFQSPEDRGRLKIVKSLLTKDSTAPDVTLSDIAVDTAAFLARDLHALVLRARQSSMLRSLQDLQYSESDIAIAGKLLNSRDFDLALSLARTSYSESIGAPQIPNVTWDDVGGLASVKSDILDTIQLPLEHPELFATGLKKRSGILLYGPPGTGKTLLAKAVATSCSLNFFSVKGPELLNMYIGESEANVRRVFQRAKDARPCVIFFDELDSIAPKRGNHGDSGGVMDRIVSQLLAELDGVAAGDAGADVFVIGATNRPDLLDPALLRPGRFDRMLYLGVSDNNDAQLNILHALTRKFKLHPDLSLENIVEACPFHYTGADFYALCADALLRAMSRTAEEVDKKISELNTNKPDPSHPYPITPQYYLSELATPADLEVLVHQEDFELALDSLIPSVSPEEMQHYARVQQQFSQQSI
ncbi:P-loop containing nucleoside triphosphate hydrolase protein [Abortiporus biennis]|nr:P-loop containing nucleoside triphosphate hydrolase protein [Abortiporus biennis]